MDVRRIVFSELATENSPPHIHIGELTLLLRRKCVEIPMEGEKGQSPPQRR
jgi:hypothetical protein